MKGLTKAARVLDALQKQANTARRVVGHFDDIKAWIGADAARWDIQTELNSLKDADKFSSHHWTFMGEFDVTLR
jgi:hypothetical protein